MNKSNIKQIEKLIEVVIRAIPTERLAHDVYINTANESKSEMIRILFQMLAGQEEQHEAKLRGALEFLKEEIEEAKGRATIAEDSTQMHDEEITDEEKIADLERVMEVVVRMIPREIAARKLYLDTARVAKGEMHKNMFEFMAEQEEQHEAKLRGVMDLLKMELAKIKSGKA
ncbi:MAG TPA: ferritin family protein [archaeon]|nr:ferritin family protein [archaeon]